VVSEQVTGALRGSPGRDQGTNVALVRQSRPDSGLGFQEKVLKPF
jgi:hypothetical protein